MKTKTRVFLIIFCIFAGSSPISLISAQDWDYWTWGTPEQDYAIDVWANEDKIFTTSRVYDDSTVTTWDINGTALTNFTMGTRNFLDFTGYEDSLYTCGRDWGNLSSLDNWVAKWDENWTQIWNYTWNSNLGDLLTDIWADDQGVIAAGRTYGDDFWSDGRDNILIMKWDTFGNLKWKISWGSDSLRETFIDMCSDGTNIYVLAAIWNPSTHLTWYEWIKWNSNGTKLLEILEEDTHAGWGNPRDITTDGTHVYMSSSHDFGGLVMKWTTEGELVWKETFGKNNYWYFHSGHIKDGDNIFTVGFRENLKTDETDRELYIYRWDTSGKIVAKKYLQFDYYHHLNDYGIYGNEIYLYGGFENVDSPYSSADTDCYMLRIPKNFTSDTIPGYSLYVITGILIVGISVIIVSMRKKMKIINEKRPG